MLAARHKLLPAFEWCTIERACRDYQRWSLAGGARPLSVNISSASLVTANFALRLAALLKRMDLPPEALVLELTEYDPVPDIDTVRDNVQHLNAHGVKLSLDDFGSGYSSPGWKRAQSFTAAQTPNKITARKAGCSNIAFSAPSK